MPLKGLFSFSLLHCLYCLLGLICWLAPASRGVCQDTLPPFSALVLLDFPQTYPSRFDPQVPGWIPVSTVDSGYGTEPLWPEPGPAINPNLKKNIVDTQQSFLSLLSLHWITDIAAPRLPAFTYDPDLSRLISRYQAGRPVDSPADSPVNDFVHTSMTFPSPVNGSPVSVAFIARGGYASELLYFDPQKKLVITLPELKPATVELPDNGLVVTEDVMISWMDSQGHIFRSSLSPETPGSVFFPDSSDHDPFLAMLALLYGAYGQVVRYSDASGNTTYRFYDEEGVLQTMSYQELVRQRRLFQLNRLFQLLPEFFGSCLPAGGGEDPGLWRHQTRPVSFATLRRIASLRAQSHELEMLQRIKKDQVCARQVPDGKQTESASRQPQPSPLAPQLLPLAPQMPPLVESVSAVSRQQPISRLLNNEDLKEEESLDSKVIEQCREALRQQLTNEEWHVFFTLLNLDEAAVDHSDHFEDYWLTARQQGVLRIPAILKALALIDRKPLATDLLLKTGYCA